MDKILGQLQAIQVIQKALQSGRTHHAWIFHGPMGVGKFTTAEAMAKILLCLTPQSDAQGEVRACGNCRSCQLMDSPHAAHPDLHVVRKELAAYSDDARIRNQKQTSIAVDVVDKHLLEPAHRSAQLNHNKVFLVDEAELLRDDAQNKMLKTLEEPPLGTFIILITSHEDRLLQTIRSRCQRVGFGRLPDEAVEAWVARQVSEREDLKLTEREQAWVTRFAQGSPGQAELAMRYRLDRWHGELEPMLDQIAGGRLPSQMGDRMAGMVDDFAKAWVDQHDNASKDAANKAGVRHMFGLLGEMCRRRIADAMGGLPVDTAEAEAELAPWLRGIDLLQQAEAELGANVQPVLLLDNLAVQWAASCRPLHAGR